MLKFGSRRCGTHVLNINKIDQEIDNDRMLLSAFRAWRAPALGRPERTDREGVIHGPPPLCSPKLRVRDRPRKSRGV
jgi:hypothetical protein